MNAEARVRALETAGTVPEGTADKVATALVAFGSDALAVVGEVSVDGDYCTLHLVRKVEHIEVLVHMPTGSVGVTG